MRDPLLDFYELPAYYDVLFPRDYVAECDFLEAISRTHGRVADRSFVELGCGPARNARELARRGYRTVGLDLSNEMLAYAQREAQKDHLALELLQGDMTDFTLAQPVALAACLWDTVLVLVENDAMVRHLRAVAKNLLPGGLYVIETTHPSFMTAEYVGNVYRGRLGDVDVELIWGQADDPYDPIAQVHTTSSLFTARRGDQILVQKRQTLPQRWYLVQELRALIDLSGAFSSVHYYGRSQLPLLPLSDGPECDGMLAVLTKG